MPQTVQNEVRFEETVKKSRFIGVLAPCGSDDDLDRLRRALWAEHPHASHVCFAARLLTPDGLVIRHSDDNEPSGSAGRPIYAHLEGNDLVDCALLVVRYFGGIKLGVGGLVRAYGNAARQVVQAAALVPYVRWRELTLELPYGQLASLEYQLGRLNATITDRQFDAGVTVALRVSEQDAPVLLEWLRQTRLLAP